MKLALNMRYLTLLLISIASFGDASAAIHLGLIGRIQPPDMNRDCIFFTLQGISEADPVMPNTPWFALPRNHIGFNEIYAALLSARAMGAPVSVYTTEQATAACGGRVGVSLVVMES